MFFTVFTSIVVIGAVVLAIAGMGKGKSAAWLQFYAKGKDAGFSIQEIELLHRLALKSNLEDPSALFWSQNQFDICIRSLIKNMYQDEGKYSNEDHDFLSKLYEYRKKIELNKPKSKSGIISSRQINESQFLRILVGGVGVFKSQLIKNTGENMIIAWPAALKEHQDIAWEGTNVSVYFWRENDAGYVFDTVVSGEVHSRGHPTLKIEHSDALFRTQSRKSVRVKLHKPAYLYHLNTREYANTLEANPGIKCFIEDLSETGCAVSIGGKAADGLRVKIQFILNKDPIVMPGTVRTTTYKEEKNHSILHIEADPLPIDVRNKILSEVFDMLPDEEEDLPFRILEEVPEDENADEGKKSGNVVSEISDEITLGLQEL
jgi:c-di-GMP-binding flagellar brake protein YcgR